jgi:hypothetical protein
VARGVGPEFKTQYCKKKKERKKEKINKRDKANDTPQAGYRQYLPIT